MLFVSASWMVLQIGMGSYRRNQRLGNEKRIHQGDITDAVVPEYTIVDYVLGFLHYTVLIPLFCIYFYSLVYEITYEGRQIYKRSKVQRRNQSEAIIRDLRCAEFAKNIACFVMGSIFSLTFFTYIIHYQGYEDLLNDLTLKGLDTTELETTPYKWLVFYSIFCPILLILGRCSHYILKFRHAIIRRFFNYNMGYIQSRKEHIYVRKPVYKRTLPLSTNK